MRDDRPDAALAGTLGSDVSRERPLSDLQQAYLLGRERHLPLGGVAMQDFRAYRGSIDVDGLPERLQDMTRRHEALRTIIDAERRVSRVLRDAPVNYGEIDLRGLSRDEALSRIEAVREDYAHALFDLSRAPWNVTAFRLPAAGNDDSDDDTAVVFARFDALILDGHAIASLLVELFGGDTPAWQPAAEAPSADKARRRDDAAYWVEKLRSFDGPPRLPWRRPLQGVAISRYERATLRIGRERFEALCHLAAGEHLFRNAAVSSLILDVLSNWLSEGALCVGIPVAPGQSAPLSNRSSFIAVAWDARQGGFGARAKAFQADVLEGLQHLSQAGVQISRLLMNVHPGGPALPVVVTNGLSWPSPADSLGIRLCAGLTQTPQVAMDVRFSEEAGDLVINIDYACEAIDGRIVRDILGAIGRQVEAMVSRGAFDVVPGEALDLGHYRFNGSEADFACSYFLRRIADNLFSAGPERTAMISDARRISYRALGETVARGLAGLRGRGVRRGDVVAICLPRGPDHTAAVLACALSGAIWVPIDAASPAERLGFLLANCRPALVVTAAPVEGYPAASPDALFAGELPPDPRSMLPDLDALSASEDPAYYLYTSGTTGRPKCVVLTNRATSNVIGRTLDEWRADETDVFISVTPLHHDMSVFDVLGSLAAGATLVQPAAGEEKDAIAWNRLVAEHGVTIWVSVPAILEMLLSCRRGEDLRSLRLIAQGGDYIKPATIAELRGLNPALRLISLGGPTETTIWSIWHEVAPEDVEGVPYGRPLPGNGYFLLNDRGEHRPAGVAGRMYAAGVNVALGYLEDGVLTQTDFVTVNDATGRPVRAFRTGDCGYYRPDSLIVFASRVDGYVKVRGVRVSLPEIESALAGYPGLAGLLIVAVGAERQGEIEVGMVYVPLQKGSPGAAELRAHARRSLPESHVPTRFLEIDVMPLSANGKFDRRKARALLEAAGAPSPTASPANARARKILDLYLGALRRTASPAIDEATEFVRIGLLPSHLRTVAAGLRDAFDVAVTPHQLLHCRNADQVDQLLREQGR